MRCESVYEHVRCESKTVLNIIISLSKMSRSVLSDFTTAILMPTAPTQKDRSTARVIRDTLEMESRVLVRTIVSFTVVLH